MKVVQMTFGGGEHTPQGRPREGAIGKVQRMLDERPWLTVGEIALAVAEPSSRVSEALNKLKHEEGAIHVPGLGKSRRSVWASPLSAARQDGIDRLHELNKAAGRVAEPLDWRPNETIPEDYYAR